VSPSKRFRVASTHAEDLASGATFEPGAVCVGVDEKDPHDQRLIEEGRLVLVSGKRSAARSKTNDDQEESK